MIATQQYAWYQIAKAAGKEWPQAIDGSMAMAKEAGFEGWEPAFAKPDEVRETADLAARHGLKVPAFYVGGTFHVADEADASIDNVLRIAAATRSLGATICVVNPNPIRWGGPENKDDAQLRVQAQALQRLGERLRPLGLTLAYHTHSPEMRAGARELHHMLLGTDPAAVKFCLDTHWIYRGAENSAVAMLDILQLYADRIVELHLRQSHNGIWSETLETGDIDYLHVASLLESARVKPLLVVERAIENGTPQTLSPVEAHRRSLAYVRRVFST